MPDKMVIGERLRKLRGSRTLKEVSTAIGASEMALSYWERGERIPNDDMKVKIADYYKRSVMFIFFKE